MPHMPAMHTSIACAGFVQSVLQVLQWSGSDARSRQVEPQQVKPVWQSCIGEQPAMHVCETQMVPAPQSSSMLQPTHVWVAASQTVGAMQSETSVHPAAQTPP